MSFVFVFLIPLLFGWVLITGLKTNLNNPTKLGSAYLLGLGAMTFVGFVGTLFGLKYSLTTILVPTLLIIAVVSFLNKKTFLQDIKPNYKPLAQEYQLWSWWMVWGIIIYLFVCAFKKGAYWPVTEFDSVCGYDFSAKYLIQYGTFNNPTMQSRNFLNGNRYLYPAFVATLDGYAYLAGLQNPHVLMTLMFASFAVAFYGLVRKYSHVFFACICTLLMVVTPEMLAHATFSLTNLPNAIFSGLGIILLVHYFKTQEVRILVLAALFTALGLWCRTDAIVFFVISAGMLLVFALVHKKWLHLLLFVSISLSTYLAWNFFTSQVLKVQASDGFVKSLAIDNEKISVIWKYVYDFAVKPHSLYGISFVVFWVFLFLNIKWIYKDFFSIVPIFIGGLAMYAGLYYFIDGTKTGVTIKSYMEMAFKRGLFTFVPLSWYFVATSPILEKLSQKLKLT
jgi:hypothetical protein